MPSDQKSTSSNSNLENTFDSEKTKQKLFRAIQEGDFEAFQEKLLELEENEVDLLEVKEPKLDNNLLHIAIRYRSSTDYSVIKGKKKMIAVLCQEKPELIKQLNANQQTPLMLGAKGGYFETCNALVRQTLETEDLAEAEEISNNTGHRLTSKLIKDRSENPEKNLEKNSNQRSYRQMENNAKDENYNDENFENEIKEIKTRKEVQALIDLRTKTLHDKYFWKAVGRALISALCPASTFGTFISAIPVIGPLADLVGTWILFPFLAVTHYKISMSHFDAVNAETLYLTWLSANLSNYSNEQKSLLNELKNTNVSEQRRIEIKKEATVLNKKITDAVDFTDENKKPKLIHPYLQDGFKDIKKLRMHDPRERTGWATPAGSMRTFVGYTADVLCGSGAAVTVGTGIASLMTGKVILGVIGATAVGILGGPVGIAILGLAALSVAAFVLYKATYKQEQAEVGERHEKLNQLNIECKNSCDLAKMKGMKKDLMNELNSPQPRQQQTVTKQNIDNVINLPQETTSNSQCDISDVQNSNNLEQDQHAENGGRLYIANNK